ncbi:MAG: hypothetical protein H6Q91_798 [Deltaproteobacteria bacterium]|nr:hypothetical protein [Deltaproteobacteria bacterium]
MTLGAQGSPRRAKNPSVSNDEDTRLVRPDGLSIRGLRHERGWSARDLAAAISTAECRATGRPVAIATRVLLGVEERNAPISYATLCLIAAGFDCNPIEILLEDPPEPEPPQR